MLFLQRLHDLIDAAGITNNKLLTDIGINKSAIFSWETRGTIPSGEIIAKIADYFHVSTDYLLGRTDDPQPAGEEKEPSPLRSTLLQNFDQLNQEGQEKLTDYSDDLVTSGKYIKSGQDRMGQTKGA